MARRPGKGKQTRRGWRQDGQGLTVGGRWMKGCWRVGEGGGDIETGRLWGGDTGVGEIMIGLGHAGFASQLSQLSSRILSGKSVYLAGPQLPPLQTEKNREMWNSTR